MNFLSIFIYLYIYKPYIIDFYLHKFTPKRSRAMAARNKLYRKTMDLVTEHLDGKVDSDARTIAHKLLKDRSLKVI